MMSNEKNQAGIKNSRLTKDSNHVITIHATAINGDKLTLQSWVTANPEDVEQREEMGRTPLIFAVLGDRAECVEVLLRSGALVNNTDNMGRTALHWAAHRGNFQCTKSLLSKGAKWTIRDQNGMTPLHLAARQRSHRCLALILKYLSPGEIDNQDNFKRTALHWSALFGNVYHIRLLVKQDANIGIPDIEGKTPLHWAACCKQPSAAQCAKILLEHAPSVINWQDYEGRTALHLTVADGTIAVADALTSIEKCNINSMDNVFRTPLHWAAMLGKADLVKLFLERKSDTSSSDSNGATPLHYAAYVNSPDTVDIFLSSPNIKDEPDLEGRRALLWAASKGANDVIQIMHKHLINMSVPDKNGATALHAAALSGYVSTCRLLLDCGAPLEAHDLMRHTPLFYASETGQADVVQALLDCHANIKWLDIEGKTVLHWAALGGHAYVCQILILRGLNPNAIDLCGRTALHCTAFAGYDDCMATLIENGADHCIPDNEGKTALHWSCSKGHINVVKVLLRYGAYPNHMMFTDDRFTPLDLALLGEHYEVAQYLMEHGGISINRIQSMAATKIQAYYRGYCVRKNFNERRKLLVKHEQLKRKRAETDALRSSSVQSKASVTTSVLEMQRNIEVENKENFVIDPNQLFSPKSFTETIINKRHHSAGCFSQSLYNHLDSSLDSSEDSSSEDTDDDEDDGVSFKHLESRGIKLNRKRFPGRPHSSGDIHNLESQSNTLRRISIQKDKNSIAEKLLDKNRNCDKIPKIKHENLDLSDLSLVSKPEFYFSKKGSRECLHIESDVVYENENLVILNHTECKIEKEHPKLSVEVVKSSCLDMMSDRKLHLSAVPTHRPKTPDSNRSRLGILKSLRKKLGRQKDEELSATHNENSEVPLSTVQDRIDPSDSSHMRKSDTNNSAYMPLKIEEEIKHRHNAAFVIQRSWRRYKRKCQNCSSVYPLGCIHTEARMAAEEIWNQCLSTVSLQTFSSTSQSSTQGDLTEEMHLGTRCSSAFPFPRQTAHYSYNLQNHWSIK